MAMRLRYGVRSALVALLCLILTALLLILGLQPPAPWQDIDLHGPDPGRPAKLVMASRCLSAPVLGQSPTS